MATTKNHQVIEWNNFHFNGPFPTKVMLDIDMDQHIPDLLDRYNDAGLEMQRLIQDSIDHNERLRAYGSGWSFSNIAHQKDRMLFNARLNIKLPILDNQLHPNTIYEAENLFFIQCGTTIKEISEFLFRRNKSLKTSGASNGQTIAGAISTGVHGSAIDIGSVQDYVVGINLIIGPGKNDMVYLERDTKPTLKDEFAASINARIIRDDAMFNAALVGLGSFGIVHGVVIEVENLFLLKRYVKKIKKTHALYLADTMDFAHSPFKIQEELEADGTGKRPYHFKYFMNPYSKEDFVGEFIFKKPYRANYPNPKGLIQKAIYKDLPTFLVKFAAKHKRIIPKIIAQMKDEAFPTVDKTVEGTLGEIFWDTDLGRIPSTAGSFGIDTANSSKALDIFINLMNKLGPFPGFVSMRFAKASEATLASTRFPMTCMIEMDCVAWKANDKLMSLETFLTHVIDEFWRNNIEFTMHWGKNAPWGYPNLASIMYGNAAEEWKKMRSTLLTEQMADLFSNDFLNTVGLSVWKVFPPAI